MQHLFYYRSNPKFEEIAFRGAYYKVEFGQVIAEIMAMDEEVFEETKKVERILREVEAEVRPLGDLSLVKEEIPKWDLSPFFKDILFWQPLIAAAGPKEFVYENLRYTSLEERIVKENGYVPHLKELSDELKGASPLQWDKLVDLFEGRGVKYIDEPNIQKGVRRCVVEYDKNYREMVAFIQRLWYHKEAYLDGTAVERAKVTKHFVKPVMQTGMAPIEDCARVFPVQEEHVRYTPGQTAYRVSELAAVEFHWLDDQCRRIVRCKLCGGLFVPIHQRGVYCSRPNPEYDNQPCTAVGPLIAHKEKVVDYPMEQDFVRNSKTFSKWCRENREGQPEEIQQEIKANYKKWKENARSAQQAFLDGTITKEDLIRALVLPAVPERSPLLYEQKQADR